MSAESRRSRLTRRVAWAATCSGALAGALAAVTAVVAIDRMTSRQADRRLAGAADVLAGEIDEGSEEGEWEPLGAIVADENAELVTSGIRLAVFSDDHRIAGDGWVPAIRPGGCETRGVVGARIRACARAHGNRVLVAAAESDEAMLRWIYAVGGGGALLLGGVLGALTGGPLTRRALRPLTELSRAIARIRPEAPDAGVLGPTSPIEEVERIRSALADRIRHVDALLEQSQRFAADAAHELRLPLTTICGELDLLLEDARSSRERDALSRVSRRAAQLGALVERLLVLATPIGVGEARSEVVALSDVIREVVAGLPDDRRERVRLRLPEEALVRGDEALLRSMVANAIENALKFSDQVVEVELDPFVGDDGEESIRMEIADRGEGIAEALRERVFQPFFRARPDATPGYGLGLSLIGHIARAHGGRAEFVDTPVGARLRVTLPYWRAGPNERPRV